MFSFSLRAVFMKDGKPLKEGDTAIRPKLANTLEKIANNAMAFYDPNNQLAKDIIADTEEAGTGIQETENFD